jgi:hypothetical protein
MNEPALLKRVPPGAIVAEPDHDRALRTFEDARAEVCEHFLLDRHRRVLRLYE